VTAIFWLVFTRREKLMRFGSYDTEDQVWMRDQTARIFHRYVLAGKHFRIDVDALLSQVRRLRASIPR
jgi:hypothetical protein